MSASGGELAGENALMLPLVLGLSAACALSLALSAAHDQRASRARKRTHVKGEQPRQAGLAEEEGSAWVIAQHDGDVGARRSGGACGKAGVNQLMSPISSLLAAAGGRKISPSAVARALLARVLSDHCALGLWFGDADVSKRAELCMQLFSTLMLGLGLQPMLHTETPDEDASLAAGLPQALLVGLLAGGMMLPATAGFRMLFLCASGRVHPQADSTLRLLAYGRLAESDHRLLSSRPLRPGGLAPAKASAGASAGAAPRGAQVLPANAPRAEAKAPLPAQRVAQGQQHELQMAPSPQQLEAGSGAHGRLPEKRLARLARLATQPMSRLDTSRVTPGDAPAGCLPAPASEEQRSTPLFALSAASSQRKDNSRIGVEEEEEEEESLEYNASPACPRAASPSGGARPSAASPARSRPASPASLQRGGAAFVGTQASLSSLHSRCDSPPPRCVLHTPPTQQRAASLDALSGERQRGLGPQRVRLSPLDTHAPISRPPPPIAAVPSARVLRALDGGTGRTKPQAHPSMRTHRRILPPGHGYCVGAEEREYSELPAALPATMYRPNPRVLKALSPLVYCTPQSPAALWDATPSRRARSPAPARPPAHAPSPPVLPVASSPSSTAAAVRRAELQRRGSGELRGSDTPACSQPYAQHRLSQEGPAASPFASPPPSPPPSPPTVRRLGFETPPPRQPLSQPRLPASFRSPGSALPLLPPRDRPSPSSRADSRGSGLGGAQQLPGGRTRTPLGRRAHFATDVLRSGSATTPAAAAAVAAAGQRALAPAHRLTDSCVERLRAAFLRHAGGVPSLGPTQLAAWLRELGFARRAEGEALVRMADARADGQLALGELLAWYDEMATAAAAREARRRQGPRARMARAAWLLEPPAPFRLAAAWWAVLAVFAVFAAIAVLSTRSTATRETELLLCGWALTCVQALAVQEPILIALAAAVPKDSF
ncbi:hypothetical protein T492DRAFT_909274 [Pavlovales sp. CCMP2436]|nr:hypothetical protein T492DRAFT_909274 [Pavlovales sp. CCMP2436]